MTGSSPDDPRAPRTTDADLPTAVPAPDAQPTGTAGHVAAAEPAAEPPATAHPDEAASVSGAPAAEPELVPAGPEPAPVETAAAEPEPAAAPAGPEVRVADVVDRSTVRHAPRYGRFILAGVALGFVVAGLLALLTPPSQYSAGDLFWILFLLLGFVFGLAAAGLAVVLDRRSLRRRDARTAERRTPPEA